MNQFVAWLLSPVTVDALETAFYENSTDPLAADIEQAVYMLEPLVVS
jgi:hypothetical protein